MITGLNENYNEASWSQEDPKRSETAGNVKYNDTGGYIGTPKNIRSLGHTGSDGNNRNIENISRIIGPLDGQVALVSDKFV